MPEIMIKPAYMDMDAEKLQAKFKELAKVGDQGQGGRRGETSGLWLALYPVL
jgi:hypothetical protein